MGFIFLLFSVIGELEFHWCSALFIVRVNIESMVHFQRFFKQIRPVAGPGKAIGGGGV